MGRPRQVTLSVLAAIAVMAAGEASAVVPVSVRAPKEVAEALTISPGPPIKTSEILLRERFEGTWPKAPWIRFAGPDAPDAMWGKSLHRASAGQRSAWCVRTGDDAPRDGEPAPQHTDSWMVAGPFDLSEAASARLEFDLWLRTENFQDLFLWLASTDGETFSGRARSTDTSGWEGVSVDLADFGSAGNLIGEQTVWIAFVYRSDHSVGFEGAYVDEVELTADAGEVGDVGRTFTTEDDFELGDLVGLEIKDDGLSLSTTWTTGSSLWIPNPLQGTVSRILVDRGSAAGAGVEVGRYRTGPEGVTLWPASVAVDFHDRAWVGNRDGGTVVTIGLSDRGGCVDRDGDGSITTSTDQDGDGVIDDDEILEWGKDECVLWESVVVNGAETVMAPGEEHELRAGTGIRGLAVDADGDVWVVSRGEGRLLHLAGASGALEASVVFPDDMVALTDVAVDPTGSLWISDASGTSLARLDPVASTVELIDIGHVSWSVAPTTDSGLVVSGWESSRLARIDTTSLEKDWEINADWQTAGLSITQDGSIWTAAASGFVTRYNSAGFQVSRVSLQNGPLATAVDAVGAVWIGGFLTPTLVRYDGTSSALLQQMSLPNTARHDGLGDQSGIRARTTTSRFGTWTVVHDSGQEATAWQSVTWSPAFDPAPRQRVRVRTSEDRTTWSEWVEATNGAALSGVAGRSIEIEVALQERDGDETVTLDELTVTPAEECNLECSSSVPTVAEVANEITFEASATATGCSAAPAWTWDFGDGDTADGSPVTHAYSAIGDVTWTATGTVDDQTCSLSGGIRVNPGQSPHGDGPQS
jgi:streptogramin lyase